MALSSLATSSVEEVASTGPGIRIFQLYLYKDRNVVAQLVRRAERAGYRAIALTVDTPRLGRREADIKNRFTSPPYLTLKNFEGLDLGKVDKADDSGLASYFAVRVDWSLNWKDVKWLQSITQLPILLKGVLTAEDARLAVQAGAAGIIVSNHGARQLDYVPATIIALEEVVKAVQGRVPVYLDGGIRRGTDVFKALALGASGIFIGRPVVFSLAADGEAGVRKVLQMLRDEFELTMALSGCRSVIYVSFGSLVVLKKRQKEEILQGLVASGRKFLWVIREDAGCEELKEMIENESRELEGLIVPWCSQVEVLCHRSIGCFMTHCGWNSTVESMVAGVPVVGFPQFSDQMTNAKMVEEVWRNGVRAAVDEEGVVGREEIKRCLDLIMGSLGGERGEEIRKCALKWKGLAMEAVKEGGSSYTNLKQFLGR